MREKLDIAWRKKGVVSCMEMRLQKKIEQNCFQQDSSTGHKARCSPDNEISRVFLHNVMEANKYTNEPSARMVAPPAHIR